MPDQVRQHDVRIRHDAATRTRVNALLEHLDRDRHVDQPTKRGGDPELAEGLGPGVEAQDVVRRPDPTLQRGEVMRQVIAAGLLVALDQDDRPLVRQLLVLQQLDHGDGCRAGVAVVGRAATVELEPIRSVDPGRVPGALADLPAVHARLLVEVPVEQVGALREDLALPRVRVDRDEEHRRPTFDLVDLGREALDALVLAPALEEPRGLVDVALLVPRLVVTAAHAGDPDVVLEEMLHALSPESLDQSSGTLYMDLATHGVSFPLKRGTRPSGSKRVGDRLLKYKFLNKTKSPSVMTEGEGVTGWGDGLSVHQDGRGEAPTQRRDGRDVMKLARRLRACLMERIWP